MAVELLIDLLESWIYAEFINRYHGQTRTGAVRWCGTLGLMGLLFLNIALADMVTFFHWSTVLVDCVIIFIYGHFFLNGSLVSHAMSVALFSLGLVAGVSCSMSISAVLGGNGVRMWMEAGSLERGLLLVVSKLFLAGYAWVVLRIKRELDGRKGRMIYGMALASPVFVVVMASLLIQMLLKADGAGENAAAYVMILAGIVTLVAIIFYLGVYALRQESENRKNQLLRDIMESQKELFKKEIEGYERIRRAEHDMKNHLLGIRYYLEKNDTAGGLEYLENLIRQTAGDSGEGSRIMQQDSLWEAMIDLKLSEAEARGIQTSKRILPGRYEKIAAMDLCVILGNLLDNAIEAEERNSLKKEISVELKETCGVVCIQIKNWVDSEEIQQASRMVSGKGDRMFHGLGLQNVKETVAKYDGRLKNEIVGNYFTSQAVLPRACLEIGGDMKHD